MGLPFSLLGRFGFNVDSLADRVYENFFSSVNNEKEFHANFIQFCSEFNKTMPGKHYFIEATRVEIEEFYKDWKIAPEGTDNKSKKGLLIQFMKDKVQIYKPSSSLMITTGCVAPGAAILLKRSGEKLPQLKKLRIDLVPDFVIVPGVTFLSLIGVRMLGLSKATSKISNKTK